MTSNKLLDSFNYLKMNLLKFIVIFTMLLSGLSSCTKNVDEKDIFDIVHNESSSIVGKWKLVKVLPTHWHPKPYDYSNYNIVYDFRANGVLKISGVIDQNYEGHNLGEYTYLFEALESGDGCKLDIVGIKNNIFCRFNYKELTIIHILPAQYYYLVKIK